MSVNQMVGAAMLIKHPELLTQGTYSELDFIPRTLPAEIARLIRKNGPAAAVPLTLVELLDEGKFEADSNQLDRIFGLIPTSSSIEMAMDTLANVREETQNSKLLRSFEQLVREVSNEQVAMADFKTEVERILSESRTLNLSYDTSGRGIRERAKTKPPLIRWRCGIDLADAGFRGIGPNGELTYGILAQKELTVISAYTKSSKTRHALNFMKQVLDDGGKVLYLLLEDDETVLTAKLEAIYIGEDVEYTDILLWWSGKLVLAGEEGKRLKAKIKEAELWFDSVQDRWFVVDGANPNFNVFSPGGITESIATYKLRHGITHVVIDYIQQISREYEVLAALAVDVRKLTMQYDVSVTALSQVSNDTMKNGRRYGEFATKNAAEWGAAAHVGITLEKLPSEFEVKFEITIARNTGGGRVLYNTFNPASGKIVHTGSDPQTDPDDEFDDVPAPKGKRRKTQGFD